MNEITLPIEPTAVAKPAIKATVQYVLVQFQPTEWATIRVNLIDEDGRIMQAHDVAMTLQESKAWKGDDMYVLNLALSKLIVATEG
jgi:hypothetical protein